MPASRSYVKLELNNNSLEMFRQTIFLSRTHFGIFYALDIFYYVSIHAPRGFTVHSLRYVKNNYKTTSKLTTCELLKKKIEEKSTTKSLMLLARCCVICTWIGVWHALKFMSGYDLLYEGKKRFLEKFKLFQEWILSLNATNNFDSQLKLLPPSPCLSLIIMHSAIWKFNCYPL